MGNESRLEGSVEAFQGVTGNPKPQVESEMLKNSGAIQKKPEVKRPHQEGRETTRIDEIWWGGWRCYRSSLKLSSRKRGRNVKEFGCDSLGLQVQDHLSSEDQCETAIHQRTNRRLVSVTLEGQAVL
jgi:hypothetical protein